MKESTDITVMCSLFVVLIIMIHILGKIGTNPKVKVTILENNTISYCIVDTSIYHDKDTVWIDLNTHLICDTCENTMKGVLQFNK